MDMAKRLAGYRRQNGSPRLTPAQTRRASHKARGALKFYRTRWVVDVNGIDRDLTIAE